MKIYCDTNTLFNNINEQKERVALERLLACHRAGSIVMYRSRVVLRELMSTRCISQQQKLVADYESLPQIPDDEKLLGFSYHNDQYGGSFAFPLISDVQSEEIYSEIRKKRLEDRDAEHITQAICNECDIFLTRDYRTIIKPHRAWLETRFFPIKIRSHQKWSDGNTIITSPAPPRGGTPNQPARRPYAAFAICRSTYCRIPPCS